MTQYAISRSSYTYRQHTIAIAYLIYVNFTPLHPLLQFPRLITSNSTRPLKPWAEPSNISICRGLQYLLDDNMYDYIVC